MTDIPEISTFVHIEDGTSFASCGEDRFTSMTELLEAYPALTDPGNEAALARLVTHFSKGRAFRVVSEPEVFEAAYRAALAEEDSTKPWRQDHPRRVDFGVPDFASIAAPSRQGDRLVFTLEDSFTGLPYAASTKLSALDQLDMTPLSLSPVSVGPEAQADQLSTTGMIETGPGPATPEADGAAGDEDLADPKVPELPEIPRRRKPQN
ncbi:hypothetical protein [Sedimentitalea sp.]|uniref:hypothetical protein n=1 Tax=Sedimentitalea sp. TaxID=2048915 RepID=UPI0032973F68